MSSVVTLVLTIGWAAGIALITFSILGVLNTTMGCLSQKQARYALKEADNRLGIMSEIINGIKAIKLCGVFMDLIHDMCMQCKQT